MADPVRIAVVDSHPLFRKGLVDTVCSAKRVVLAEGETTDDAMRIVGRLKPDILIIDIAISGDVIEVAEKAKRMHRDLKIMILTASDDETDIADALRVGIHGYILKGVTGTELLHAIDTIAAGTPYITPTLASRLLVKTKGKAILADKPLDMGLSVRDRWVLHHLVRGLTNQQLALELGVNVRTVKYYLSRIFRKLQVRNRVEAIVKAQKLRIDVTGHP